MVTRHEKTDRGKRSKNDLCQRGLDTRRRCRQRLNADEVRKPFDTTIATCP
jgi:hypothetical protein